LSARVIIALDAMGGDRAPDMVLRGASIAVQRHPDAHFLLYGVESKLAPAAAKLPRLKDHITIHHTDDVVTSDVRPSIALRTGRRSSMRLAIDAVVAGEADCVVSAGNTGALMAMAKFGLRMMPGIDRPAMASFFPTQRGESVLLDLGANVECDAENLVQFALMGEVFARPVLGLLIPSLALHKLGSDELK
jgi:glycerol-3-phosphate acyltransferase PlsX